MIVLDTHVLLWSQFDQKKLGKKSNLLLERFWEQAQVAVSSMTFWEIGMLTQRGRLELKRPLNEWRIELINGGLTEIALTSEIALRALDFSGLHADPVDRFIAATAVVQNANLMTADEKLLDWRHPLERHDAQL